MNGWQPEREGLLVGQGPGHRLDGVSDDDLLFLFSYDADRRRKDEPPSTIGGDTLPGIAAPDVVADVGARDPLPGSPLALPPAESAMEDPSPAETEGRACEEPGTEQVILRLGDEPVAVSVRPDPRPVWMGLDEPQPVSAGSRTSSDASPTSPDDDAARPDETLASSHEAQASFELARWVEAVAPDYLGPVDEQTPPVAGPAVLRVEVPAAAVDQPCATETTEPTTADTPKQEAEPPVRPLVMRFAPRDPATKRAKATRALPRRAEPLARSRMRRRESFRWRRMLGSAALCGGLGCAVLLVVHWICS